MSSSTAAAPLSARWLPRGRRLSPTSAATAALLVLLAAMVAQGYAISHSYLWGAPLLALLLVALAPDLPVVPTLTVGLVARVLTSEALSSRRAQYSTSLNLSAVIAVLFILLAVGLLLRRRRHAGLAGAAAGWLCFFTAVAVGTHGGAALTFREGLREASIVAVAVIVWNAAGALTVHRAVRIVQMAGAGAALLALYQLVTHTGLNIEGQIRSNGTFTHPNGAAVYFAIAVTASLWCYMDHGRRGIDGLLVLVFAAATISTFSIGGLASLLVMLVTYGLTRPTAPRVKVASCFLGLLVIAAFAATPLGARRLENESATSLASAHTRGAANTSLAWRFYKWRTLLPLWEKAPLFGQGLGSTVTAEGTAENETAGKVPHNEYVRYLVETGALGLASLLVTLALLFRALWRAKPRAPNNIVSLGLGIAAGCTLNGFGDNTLLYSTTGYAAALIVAAVLVATRAPAGTRSSP